VISVDVESDWFGKEENSLTSIQGLHFVQDISIKYGIPVTYLVTYECAVREEALGIIRRFMDTGFCEVGHHCHVWSTPPFENPNPYDVDTRWINAVQSELPDHVFSLKMKNLHEAIEKNYGCTPRSHRAGRWSIDERTFHWLEDNGYIVDSSMCSYMTYRKRNMNGSMREEKFGMLSSPFYPDREDIARDITPCDPSRRFKVLEVPVTGIKGDFLRGFEFRGVDRVRNILSLFGFCGTRPISFRPSWEIPLRVFERAAHRIFEAYDYIHFMFHSNELTLGTSPYSMTVDHVNLIRRKIDCVFRTAAAYGIRGIKLSDTKKNYDAGMTSEPDEHKSGS